MSTPETLKVLRRLGGVVCIGLLISGASAPYLRAGEIVPWATDLAAGTIVVQTSQRALYSIIDFQTAIRYSVGVGRPETQWVGQTQIEAKFVEPNWIPPHQIRRDNPSLPDIIAGGAPNNPMGAAAMTLTGGTYAIHGTNVPDSVGGFVSYGCIRMHNADIVDLFARTEVGGVVYVLP